MIMRCQFRGDFAMVESPSVAWLSILPVFFALPE